MDQQSQPRYAHTELAKALHRRERQLASAVRIHQCSLLLLPVTVALMIFPVHSIHLHWGVPMFQVFAVIPMFGIIGFCRVRVSETRSRL